MFYDQMLWKKFLSRRVEMKRSKLVILIINLLFVSVAVIVAIVSVVRLLSVNYVSEGIGLVSEIFLSAVVVLIPLLIIDVAYLLVRELKRKD